MSVAAFPKHFSAYLNTLGGAQAGTLNGLPSGTAVTTPFHQTLEFQARRRRVAIHQFPIDFWGVSLRANLRPRRYDAEGIAATEIKEA